MTNPMYVHTSGVPVQSARGLSSAIRTELDLIEDGFDLAAPLASPALTGTPTVPTAAPGTTTTQAANAAFVSAAITLAYGSAYTNSTGTASDSVAIGTGAKSFTTQTGKNWVAGMFMVIYADATDYMLATVTSYSGTALVVNSVAVVGSGTFASWGIFSQPYARYPILSAAAAAVNPVSTTEVMENSLSDTGLGAQAITQVVYGNSLFLAASGSNANIATAPNVTGAPVWTLRAMPSTAVWSIAANGTTGFVAVVASATTTAKSTDGTTWVSGGALPAAAHATTPVPVYNGTIALCKSNTASTVYTTVDNGANWLAQTTPTTIGALNPFVVGGLFWYYNATTVAYTSPTGATGDWTVRTLPVSAPNYVYQDFDGALLISVDDLTIYRTTDGINWAVLAITALATPPTRLINGVYASFSTTFGSASTTHNGTRVVRTSACADTGTATQIRVAKNTGGTIFLIPAGAANGKVAYIEPAGTTGKTALFSR